MQSYFYKKWGGATLSKNNELNIYQKEYEQKLKETKAVYNENEQRINRKETSLIPIAQYKLDTDRSLYENLNDAINQGFIDTDFNKDKYKGKSQITSGLVVYEDRNHRTEVIFEGNFEVIGSYNFSAQTEKIKDTLEECLVTQYLDTQNPTIVISIKKLADEINVRPSDLRKRIVYIMDSLQTIRISYKTKGKLKKNTFFTDFASMRIISSSEYHTDTDLLEVNFDNKYAYNLASHNFFQLPKKYRKISDNSFQYAYPLSKYVFELCRHNNNKITFRTLYGQIKKIPRIEEIKKQRGSPTQKIYEPLIKHFHELNNIGDFSISFENEDFMLLDAKRNIDFDKMLDTNIIIKWKNKPNYDNIQSNNNKRDKIIKERQQLFDNANKELKQLN